ncbi:hypothetical protein JNM05_04885 [bacterium]|nr:hypothetical protein [bacterium]
MPSPLDDLKKEFGKGTDFFSRKVVEFSAAAKEQVELLELKKDRYLKQKELGELTFQLICNEHEQNVEENPRIKALVSAIDIYNRKIEALQMQHNKK